MATRDSLFIEYISGAPTQVHMVRMPGVVEKDFSRTAKAFQMFCDHETKRVVDDHHAGTKTVNHWFYAQREDEWNRNVEIYAKFMSPLPATIEHPNLDAFFEHIGFDRKTKKFLEGRLK